MSAAAHVVERCPSCGVEHDVADAGECEACHTPLRPWCRRHGREMGWLDAPACPRCGEEARRARPARQRPRRARNRRTPRGASAPAPPKPVPAPVATPAPARPAAPPPAWVPPKRSLAVVALRAVPGLVSRVGDVLLVMIMGTIVVGLLGFVTGALYTAVITTGFDAETAVRWAARGGLWGLLVGLVIGVLYAAGVVGEPRKGV